MGSDNFRLHALANASVLDSVDARTRLAGSNMMELLLFSLGTEEVFGINVFKVREITHTPKITRAPNLPPAIAGLVCLRGSIIPVISLAAIVVGGASSCSNEMMMVTEFNRHVQGFLMQGIERIVRVEWSCVRAPDAMLTGDNYITAVTQLPDGTLVTVLDVEQVLATAYGETEVPELAPAPSSDATVFFADDSAVARKEIARVLDRPRCALSAREEWARSLGTAAVPRRARASRRRTSHERGSDRAHGRRNAGNGRLRAHAQHQERCALQRCPRRHAFLTLVGRQPLDGR